MRNRGAIYVAYGHAARSECAQSIASLRATNKGLPVAVISDVLLGIKGVQDIAFPARDAGARWAKVNIDRLSPFEDTLYLDADTRVRGSLQVGFDALADGWDMAITHSKGQLDGWLWHVGEAEREATSETLAGRLLQLQGGLWWVRRTDKTTRFFELWRAEWERWKSMDQGALLRALYREPLRIWLVSRAFNGGSVVEHHFGAAVTQ